MRTAQWLLPSLVLVVVALSACSSSPGEPAGTEATATSTGGAPDESDPDLELEAELQREEEERFADERLFYFVYELTHAGREIWTASVYPGYTFDYLGGDDEEPEVELLDATEDLQWCGAKLHAVLADAPEGLFLRERRWLPLACGYLESVGHLLERAVSERSIAVARLALPLLLRAEVHVRLSGFGGLWGAAFTNDEDGSLMLDPYWELEARFECSGVTDDGEEKGTLIVRERDLVLVREDATRAGAEAAADALDAPLATTDCR